MTRPATTTTQVFSTISRMHIRLPRNWPVSFFLITCKIVAREQVLRAAPGSQRRIWKCKPLSGGNGVRLYLPNLSRWPYIKIVQSSANWIILLDWEYAYEPEMSSLVFGIVNYVSRVATPNWLSILSNVPLEYVILSMVRWKQLCLGSAWIQYLAERRGKHFSFQEWSSAASQYDRHQCHLQRYGCDGHW